MTKKLRQANQINERCEPVASSETAQNTQTVQIPPSILQDVGLLQLQNMELQRQIAFLGEELRKATSRIKELEKE